MVDTELLFSDEYINNVTERLSLYNELASVKNEEEFHFWKIDEPDFGLLTRSVIMNNIHQMDCQSFKNRRLVMKWAWITCVRQQSDYYKSNRFGCHILFKTQFDL
jgi:transcription-repair coupling factor (superfamily II helicase)